MRTLWRATAEGGNFGFQSWWAPEEDHARRYTAMPGFGGPKLYRATVDVDDASVLDLRTDPWGVLRQEFGLERDDYGAGELDHELIWSLARVLAAGGNYTWAVLAVEHPTGTHEEWLRLGDEPVPAERA